MQEALTARLLASASIEASAGDRISWGERPQGEALPALSMELIDGGRDYTHEGPVDLTYGLVQFDCWANTYLEAVQLSRALIAEMEAPASVPAFNVAFEESLLERHFDRPAENLDNGVKVFGVTLDFRVPFRPI